MYENDWGPEPAIDSWEEIVSEQYNEYILERCKCISEQECECLSFEQFKDDLIEEMNNHFDNLAEIYEEERFA